MATAASTRVFTGQSISLIENWHLLSLDAPTVAALWASALCVATHTPIPFCSILFLSLGTWLLYAVDRILDGTRDGDVRRLRERHYFHWEHRRAFGAVGAVACVAVVGLSTSFIAGEALRDYSVVLLAALGYFLIVHWEEAASERWLPKEFVVGVVFAAGVGVPAWSQLQSSHSRFGLPGGLVLLAALFWLNCFAIESWERGRDSSEKMKWMLGLDRTWPGRALPSLGVQLIAAGIAGTSAFLLMGDLRLGKTSALAPIYFSVLMSAAVLSQLDRFHDRISPLRLRIAADAALLTPLLFVILPQMLSSAPSTVFRTG